MYKYLNKTINLTKYIQKFNLICNFFNDQISFKRAFTGFVCSFVSTMEQLYLDSTYAKFPSRRIVTLYYQIHCENVRLFQMILECETRKYLI